MAVPNRVVYSDLPINLSVHPVKKDLTRVTNNDAIKRSVKNLILTSFYERPFRPFVGSNVTSYLFENFTSITEENIEDAIYEVIRNYEPRAELLNVRVNAQPDRNRFSVTIIFRAVNQTEPVEVEFFLNRVR
ncbi:GPW/gp25 family protein [Methanohalobium sp.]|uniref:GPW/gp25 family protein n=1 Tax=Methanohalobium sp. TaxID=2837493 RepID=UPI0025EBBF1C|nr:GPW/gp25 family protein [Methanohalobium sp.]